MSGPRNNLDDVLKKRQKTATTTAGPVASTSQSQEGSSKSKFRVAGKSAPAQPAAKSTPLAKTPSYNSFSTPGFGKKKPDPLVASSNSPVVVVSSTETTPVHAQAKRTAQTAGGPSTPVSQAIATLPAKRNSPSTFHTTDPPLKRLRADAPPGKENVFDTRSGEWEEDDDAAADGDTNGDVSAVSARDKGKGREMPRQAPPATPRNINFNDIRTRPMGRFTGSTPANPSGSAAFQRTPYVEKASSTPVTASQTESSAASRLSIITEATESHVLRHCTLDYSDMLTTSVEDLVDMKLNLADLKLRMVDVRESFDSNGVHALKMLRQLEEMIQDKLSCIDALVSARKAGRPPSLPAPRWTTLGLPTTVPSARVANTAVPSRFNHDPIEEPPPPPRPRDVFEPYDGPSLLEEEPQDDSIDIDEDYTRTAAAAVEEYDSDGGLWDKFEDLAPVEPPPLPPPPPAPAPAPLPVPSRSISRAPSMPPLPVAPAAPDPKLMLTPYYADLAAALRDIFKLPGFRPNQLESISASMDGLDVFLLMPTGGGKSLCYQLPAVVQHARYGKVTLVITPLVSLMYDQMHALQAKGVRVARFSGDMTAAEIERIHRSLRSDDERPAVLFCTPEKLDSSQRLKNDIMWLWNNGKLAFIVFDEVHCISTWGRNFRESYAKLNWFRDNVPDVPIIALTATASRQAIKDIINGVKIQNCKRITMSFNRPNLSYEVRPRRSKVDTLKEIVEFINTKHKGQTGIIYVNSRSGAEDLARELRTDYRIGAHHYHAFLSDRDKEDVQKSWQSGRFPIIVATIAFGMGIDKADVRFVIHYTLPSSLSGYYQETGRAGRDGKPSDCILYYAYKDASFMIRRAREELTKASDVQDQEDAIRRVIQYAQNNVDCRRAQVLSYFDEKFDPQRCNKTCDNCKNPGPVSREDVTDAAYKLIKLGQEVEQMDGLASRNMIVDLFLGKLQQATRQKGFDKLSSLGAGKGMQKGRVERIFDHLVALGVFEPYVVANGSSYHNEYAQITPKGAQFIARRERLIMGFREPPPKPPRKTKSKAGAPESQGTSAAAKRTRRVAEIPEDPIDQYDEDALYVPEAVNEPAPVAGPSTNTRQAATRNEPAQPSAIVVSDSDDGEQNYWGDDDDIEILDGPDGGDTAAVDRLPRECLAKLKQQRDRISKEQGIALHEFIPDDILQLLSLLLPSDIGEMRRSLQDNGVDVAPISAYLPALNDICLTYKMRMPPDWGAGAKPPSKSTLGSRPKPPSIVELRDYQYRQAGPSSASASASASASKPPSTRKRR